MNRDWTQKGEQSCVSAPGCVANSLQAEFERATGRGVDLVAIDTAAVPLRWRIARDGIS